MRLEETTFYQLKPGDLFFYPGDQGTAGVQVRTVYGKPDEGDAKVIRIVPDAAILP